MPLLRIKEIREMSPEDRTKRIDEFRTELLRLKTMIGAGGTVENPARVKALRKTIAKILTVEREKTLRPERKETKEKEPEKAEPRKTEPRKKKTRKMKKE